jgi:hypothetical protein
MNIKSFTTLGLVAVALVVTSLAPAQASNNNNKALNNLAMQYYMQNQAAAGRTNVYNTPLLTGSTSVYNPLAANYSYASTPWAAGAIPGYANVVSPVVSPLLTGSNMYGLTNNYGCNGGINNAAYSNIVAPQYAYVNNEINKLETHLATTNPNSWEAVKLQNKIVKLQQTENNMAASGYGAPYGYGGSLLNNVRGFVHL